MAIPKRNARIPGTYFVTSSTYGHRATFQVIRHCEIFVEHLHRCRSQRIFLLHSFVLMPDHFHLILTPAPEITLERAVQFVKGGSSHAMGMLANRNAPIWQRGFSDHRIRELNDYGIHLNYINMNPVRRGLVESPERFRWCSASGLYKMDAVPQRLKPYVGDDVQHG